MAKRAFSHCADDYAAHRPDYPAALLDLLEASFGPAAGKTALDVGAGTGIFSRQLAGAGWSVIATDADPAMLGRAGPPVGRIQFATAVAERIPLDDGSVDLVTAAQAFHWFNPPIALAEFARVLKPGGGLALVWNDRDAADSDFLRAYDALIQEFNPAYRREYRTQDWAAKIEQSGQFQSVRRWTTVRSWRRAADAFVAYTRTVSYLRNVLSADARTDFETRLRELIERIFGGSPCEFPLRTNAWLAVRDPDPAVDGR